MHEVQVSAAARGDSSSPGGSQRPTAPIALPGVKKNLEGQIVYLQPETRRPNGGVAFSSAEL